MWQDFGSGQEGWNIVEKEDKDDDGKTEPEGLPSRMKSILTKVGVLVSAATPVDTNVGKRHGGLASVTSAVGYRAKSTRKQKTKTKELIKSPIEELCKITDVSDYNEALTRYEDGLKAGWTTEESLEMIQAIRKRRDNASEEEHQATVY